MTPTNRTSNTKRDIGNNIKGITLDGAVVWDPKDLDRAVKAVLKSRMPPKPKKVYKMRHYESFTHCPRCKYYNLTWKEVEAN